MKLIIAKDTVELGKRSATHTAELIYFKEKGVLPCNTPFNATKNSLMLRLFFIYYSHVSGLNGGIF